MPKEKTSDDAAPQAAVAENESPGTKDAVVAEQGLAAGDSQSIPTKKKYRNISSMLLTLDDGSHFPRNTIAALTTAEANRFQQAERNTHRAHIAPVGGE